MDVSMDAMVRACGGAVVSGPVTPTRRDGAIQVLNETVRLSKRYAHEFVRVVVRTCAQTLSVYWRPSPEGKFKRIAHRAYKLREKARTPFL